MVLDYWTRWLSCSYMVKTLKKLLLQYWESFVAESWYTASRTQGLPSLLKWWYQDDLWPFLWYGQICVPVAVAILEDCYIVFVNMQVSELWPMSLLFLVCVFLFLFFVFVCFVFFCLFVFHVYWQEEFPQLSFTDMSSCFNARRLSIISNSIHN